MMHRFVGMLVAISMLMAGQAIAADKWLKKKNPEELFTYIDVHGCPLDTAEVTDLVHAKLVRSRIKPLSEWSSGDVVLYVVLDCSSDTTATWVFSQIVMLAKIKREGRDDSVVSFRHDDQLPSFGKGGESFITDNLNKAVEAAFLKYLNANFDLGPGD